tara:strand:+ start:34 stop:471 length:438 start_codon:yes stop_codon:yes gene_type:complete
MAEYTQRKIITSKDIVPKSRAFTDVLTSFTMHPATHDAAKVKNYAAIKQAMKNLVLTQPGERFYEPDMGCRVTGSLFEPLDAFLAQTIQEEIINTISEFDERVRIEDVKVLTNNERHYVTVQVFYAIVGQPKVEQIDFILERPSG